MENYSRSAPNVLFQGALEGPSDADARYAATPAMVLHGNQETFNLNPLLANCILNHEYSRVLWEMGPSFDKLVAEARTKVTHVEPWQRGTSRTPSTAFGKQSRTLERGRTSNFTRKQAPRLAHRSREGTRARTR